MPALSSLRAPFVAVKIERRDVGLDGARTAAWYFDYVGRARFELQGRRVSLLDTPGHKDFSEDTYRALIAADSVVMVIDAANGVESQTRKLYEVCRRHRLPILTFVNKFDRPAKILLALMDDIETTLGIAGRK